MGYKSIDKDDTRAVTMEQFAASVADEEIANFLSLVDIDPRDAWTLFKLLDQNSSNTIDPEEFVDGCLLLHGPAKSIDLAKLMYHCNGLSRRVDRIMHVTVESLRALTHAGGTSMTPRSDSNKASL